MKVALVTGAAKGLGFEWCHQLGLKGYKVILTARNLEQAQHAANELNQQDLVIYPKALDVANESEIEELASWATELFGRVDLIVNNAGINPKDYPDKSRMAKAFYLAQLDYQEMLQVMQINSLAPLMVVKHFLPLLKKSENPLVVNISSWLSSVSQLSFGGHYGYVGSKNLLNVLNKSMALELKNEGIICVNVNPGWVKTQMGGQKATFTTEESVKNLIENIVEKVSLEDTGSFLNFDGSPHPW
ncbi:NAD(P)-dependent dehydrogenase (short-subunit alcohol dehydrogenase family) [Algoriphagus boseongensis]|uniref:NAD(P)-dependent dehydrogenase (Short-subunit alcohol dehydrogenase family) n=1 Tax=Algoriphagus boseongensis TaxID=1442587 RepID=A0A4R6TC78_9BACT|nr:SDR family oxidoreductase [Algoriphagus boseongensis]TDQ19064.1 NAD(P)-dependent dehydrogenase (short-subunit alcohol dehydrogenase family) [Algoriphagus boseongensis]